MEVTPILAIFNLLKMNHIDELTEYFKKFPGIGPRQAKRIVWYILRQDKIIIENLLKKIRETFNSVRKCPDCNGYFDHNKNEKCNICQNSNRNDNLIIIVGNDNDLEIIEKNHIHKGKYYVLGNYFNLNLDEKIIINILNNILKNLNNRADLKEIILALSATPDGDYTSQKIIFFLKENLKTKEIKISKLARGLSTGTEIEYSDSNTLKSAFENRETN
jgi:recombination protein RecR